MGGCGLRAARRVADRSCVSTGGPCGPSGRGAAPQHVGVPRACGPAARDTMRGPGLRRGCGELGAGRADGLGGGPGRGSSEAGPRPPGRARARPGECRLRGWRCQRLGCAGRVRPGVPPVPAPASGQARGPAAPDVGRGPTGVSSRSRTPTWRGCSAIRTTMGSPSTGGCTPRSWRAAAATPAAATGYRGISARSGYGRIHARSLSGK